MTKVITDELNEEQQRIVDRMTEKGIHPFKAKLNGVDVKVYMVDNDGCWWGTKQNTNTEHGEKGLKHTNK